MSDTGTSRQRVGTTPPGGTATEKPTFGQDRTGWRIRVPMRWKLLTAFAGAFTVVFGILAIWTFQFVTSTASHRLETELASSATGGAATLDAATFAQLVKTVQAVPNPANKYGRGYPDSPLYEQVARELLHVRQIVGDAGVYSYYREPADGKLYFVANGAYLISPGVGVTYKVPVADVVGAQTYKHMEQGLTRTTNEPAYSDGFGNWISAYAPIRGTDGSVVGAIGLDYPLTYVSMVQHQVQRLLLPVLIVSYAILMLLVLMIATSLTRPLNRLTQAVARVADGEYDLDLSKVVPSRFPDEMYTLAEAFSVMAVKVAQREANLTNEVRRLKVEIDHVRREEAVKEIVDSDFFADLTAKAAQMRRRMRGEDEPNAQDPDRTGNQPPRGGQ